MPTLTVLQNTFLKQSTDQASSLPDDKKYYLKAGESLEYIKRDYKDANHQSVQLKVPLKGFTNWLVFTQHVKFSDQKEYLTLDQLYNICVWNTKSELQKFLPALNAGFEKFGVTTRLRIAHFLAQVLHESGEFQYQEELASGDDYEGRTDLGNTQPGDGRRFKGRGLIQVTGFYNYQQISKALGIDYVNNPKKLAEIPDCVNSAFWYWNSRGLSNYADKDDLDQITYKINGGYNGIDQREKYLVRAKGALGI